MRQRMNPCPWRTIPPKLTFLRPMTMIHLCQDLAHCSRVLITYLLLQHHLSMGGLCPTTVPPLFPRGISLYVVQGRPHATARIYVLRGNSDSHSAGIPAARRCSSMASTVPLSLSLSQAPFIPRLTSLCSACARIWLHHL